MLKKILFIVFMLTITCLELSAHPKRRQRQPPIYFQAVPNPFILNLPRLSREISNLEYQGIQTMLRTMDITPFLRDMYFLGCQGLRFTSLHNFEYRCSKGIRQILIDEERGYFPKKELIKIGQGSNRCIVCCAPFNGKYPDYIKSLPRALEEVGFDGYLLSYLGGWPNPTGEEINYVAVPYCFKIFAMVEAHHLGFNEVLWIDSACYPLRNPSDLFQIIERDGALLHWYPFPWDHERYIFPQTKQLLQELTGVNIAHGQFIMSIVMGIKMDSQEAQDFVQTYYDFVKLGTPFLSCFPEEFVFTAIINNGHYPNWIKNKTPRLVQPSFTGADDSPHEFDLLRKKGFYFYHRKGR